jgi:ribosome-binding factor A
MQRHLQAVIARGLQDPRIKGLITVTSVRVTEDLATAIVSVSVYPSERQSATIHGLRAAAGYLRRELGNHIEIKKLPQLRFEIDDSVKREAEVLAALEQVRQEREQRETGPDDHESADTECGDGGEPSVEQEPTG